MTRFPRAEAGVSGHKPSEAWLTGGGKRHRPRPPWGPPGAAGPAGIWARLLAATQWDNTFLWFEATSLWHVATTALGNRDTYTIPEEDGELSVSQEAEDQGWRH